MEVPKSTLGVLGGMGPEATNDFLGRLATLTGASRDQEHVRTLVYSDPTTPDRSDAILGDGPSPFPWLERGVSFLNSAGCTVIAIPCNTAHFWHAELQAASPTRILHIAKCVTEELSARPSLRNVALLATAGTIRSGIYYDYIDAAGISISRDQSSHAEPAVMNAIRVAKAGRMKEAAEIIAKETESYPAGNVDGIVVACTDLSAALAGVSELHGIPLLDASSCLARAAVSAIKSDQTDCHDASRGDGSAA